MGWTRPQGHSLPVNLWSGPHVARARGLSIPARSPGTNSLSPAQPRCPWVNWAWHALRAGTGILGAYSGRSASTRGMSVEDVTVTYEPVVTMGVGMPPTMPRSPSSGELVLTGAAEQEAAGASPGDPPPGSQPSALPPAPASPQAWKSQQQRAPILSQNCRVPAEPCASCLPTSEDRC